MTLSNIERNYYIQRKKRALGFIARLTERFNAAVACHARDVQECDEKLLTPVGSVEDLAEREIPLPPYLGMKNL